jgi:DNA-binding transcriptional MerR regulator
MERTGDERLLPIGEVAERTGVSRRTVRFYVQQGLISPPVGRGRASGYTSDHVRQIVRVRQLQRDGVELRTIRELEDDGATVSSASRSAPSGEKPLPATSVIRIELAPGIRLEVDARQSPPSGPVLMAIREACQRILGASRGA